MIIKKFIKDKLNNRDYNILSNIYSFIELTENRNI